MLQCRGQWDSHHSHACKYSVIDTLTHRAKAVCSNSELLKKELKHLQCKYPKWAIDKVLQQQEGKEQRNRRKQGSNNTSQTNKRCHIVVPYLQDLCKSSKNICGRYGVQLHFKGGGHFEKSVDVPKRQRGHNKTEQHHLLVQVWQD